MRPRRPVAVSVALLVSVVAGVGDARLARADPDGPPVASAPAARPGVDAGLFGRIAGAAAVDSPDSSQEFHRDPWPDRPPFGERWTRLAAAAWRANGRARAMARDARAVDRVGWPADTFGIVRALDDARRVARDLGDAALVQHLAGDNAGAVETVRDVLHVGDLIRGRPDGPLPLIRLLVAVGTDSTALARLAVIVSDVTIVPIVAGPADPPGAPSPAPSPAPPPPVDPDAPPTPGRPLPIADARRLVADLLAPQPTPRERLRAILGDRLPAAIRDGEVKDHTLEALRRGSAERQLVGMSLAAHVFRHARGRWPQSLDELSAELPGGAPPDPWGDGAQTLGYVLIPGGLPDGSARPLVYSRAETPDGLYYPATRPQYGWYQGGPGDADDVGDEGDEGDAPPPWIKGGQFRDVARWPSDAPTPPGPAMRRLP